MRMHVPSLERSTAWFVDDQVAREGLLPRNLEGRLAAVSYSWCARQDLNL